MRARVGVSVFAHAATLACTLVAATGCGEPTAAQGNAAPPPPLPVSVVRVVPRDVVWAPDHLAQTAASRIVDVRARVQGTVIERSFTEGGEVHAGDVLYRIDPRPFEAARDAAQARQSEARAHLEETERAVARKQQLFESEAIPRRELEDALTEQSLAQAQVATTQAQLQQALLDLEYTVITAPFDGRAAKANYEAGSYINSFANPILTVITKLDPIYVSFRVSERELIESQRMLGSGDLAEDGAGNGQQVEIERIDGARYEHLGRINYRSDHVDPATGTTEVRAELPNPDGVLLPGQFVRARVLGLVRNEVITVPQRAVLMGPSTPFVYVVGDDGQVQVRNVRVTQWDGSEWIVEQGLNEGERVIVDGLQKLGPGAKVEPKEIAAADAATPPANDTPAAGAPKK